MVLRILATISFLTTVYCCTEGRDNVIKIFDTSTEAGKIKFEGLELWTYDEQKRPACRKGSPVIVTPGHVKLSGGTVKMPDSVTDSVDSLHILLSAEKNSWLVGKVCQQGKSTNTFVKDKHCKHNICKSLGGEVCNMLKLPKGLTEIPPEAKELLYIPAPSSSYADGKWKLSLQIADADGKVVASLRLGNSDDWLTVSTDSSILDRHVVYAHEEL